MCTFQGLLQLVTVRLSTPQTKKTASEQSLKHAQLTGCGHQISFFVSLNLELGIPGESYLKRSVVFPGY